MRIRSSTPARIVIATTAVVAAYVGTRLLGLPAVGGVSPLFFAAVAVSAYFGGMWSGLLATALSAAATSFLFEHPFSQPSLGFDDIIRLLGFLAVALLISSLQRGTELAMERLVDARAEAERQREEAERAREQAVRANLAKDRFLNVLGHELRNPLSPILSVATLRLQDLQQRVGANGSAGTEELAQEVVRLCESGEANFEPLYSDDTPLWDKVKTIATKLYGASDITADSSVRQRFKNLQADYGHFPVCMAKTQYSFSTDPNLKGAPSGHVLPVREVRLSAGAEFIVVICGEIMTMPGLPKVPAANHIRLNDAGEIEGLF